MRKVVATVLLCLSVTVALAQAEIDNSKQVFFKFKSYYNAGQPDTIYAMFSKEAKINLPLNKTKAFLQQLMKGFGHIKSGEFIAYRASYAQYKTWFEKGQVSLNLALNEKQEITGLFARPYMDTVKNNQSRMELPFKGEWTMFWGGDTKGLNQHIGVKFQRNAFDIVINNAAAKSYRTDGKTNEDYYAFGQPITAPCAGVVVCAVDGVKDNIPGVVNTLYIPGNSIIIKTVLNEYVFMAHFKQHSIKVKEGDVIKPGQPLGLCGNSGNSSEPHLHFHIQDQADPLLASGIKCNFGSITVNGLTKENYSPVKGDRVSNAAN